MKASGLRLVVKKVSELKRQRRLADAERRKSLVADSALFAERLGRVEHDLIKIALGGLLTDAVLSQIDCELWSQSYINIDRATLPAWRAIGKLSAIRKEFAETDADGRNWIDVTVRVEGLTRTLLRYRRELPASATCRVEKQVSTYRYKSLVCSRD